MKKQLFFLLFASMHAVSASQTQVEAVKDNVMNLLDDLHPMYGFFHDIVNIEADINALKNLIQKNYDSFSSDPAFINKVLLKAIKSYVQPIVEFLVEAGVNLDTPGEDGKTPLMVAADSGNVPAMRLLMEHGVNPNLQNEKDGYKTAAAYALGENKKIFDTTLKKQLAEKNAYEASKQPVQAELKKYLIDDISNLVKDYAYPDDYNDYLDFTQNTTKLAQSTKQKSKKDCIVQ